MQPSPSATGVSDEQEITSLRIGIATRRGAGQRGRRADTRRNDGDRRRRQHGRPPAGRFRRQRHPRLTRRATEATKATIDPVPTAADPVADEGEARPGAQSGNLSTAEPLRRARPRGRRRLVARRKASSTELREALERELEQNASTSSAPSSAHRGLARAIWCEGSHRRIARSSPGVRVAACPTGTEFRSGRWARLSKPTLASSRVNRPE